MALDHRGEAFERLESLPFERPSASAVGPNAGNEAVSESITTSVSFPAARSMLPPSMVRVENPVIFELEVFR